MDSLNNFTIPFKGLGDGIHQFDFQIDKRFFSHFEDSPISEGDMGIKLTLDKRIMTLVLDFELNGKVTSSCDRCLSPIQLPIAQTNQLIVKIVEIAREEEEIVYLLDHQRELNVAKYIYEYICLSMPIIKSCDQVEGAVCDEQMLKYLQKEQKEEQKPDNPIWDELKKFDNN